MDLRLKHWLEDAFEEQILLGHHWLQDKHGKKRSGVKWEREENWEGVYHDNGSCLDIINDIHPESKSALEVTQVNPLTLTDGQSHVVAHITADCVRDLLHRHPGLPHLPRRSVIAVRKYTIRYTSYGPPRENLRFILHRVDWLGAGGRQTDRASCEATKPLRQSERIGLLLQQLHHTRAQEDRRCLAAGIEAEEVVVVEEEGAIADAMDESLDGPPGDGNAYTQPPHTQLPFGTQLPIPTRARPSEEEPQIMGVKRLEPVMAGSTRREEIRPTNNVNQLLGLLERSSKPNTSGGSATSVPGFIQSAFSKQPNAASPTTPASPEAPSKLPYQQSTRSPAEDESASVISPAPNRGKRRATEPMPLSPEPAEPEEVIVAIEQENEQVQAQDVTPLCAWMNGLIFNREALKVPKLQQEILTKETSWLKPQPGGTPFQDGNMPQMIIQTIHRMADEKATDMDDRSDIDPSPDSPLPWSSSPEPPQRPERLGQQLPPDSSFEPRPTNPEDNVGSPWKSPNPPSGSPPVIDIPDDGEPVVPPSSPPAAVAPADSDSDEEMEMEESVPQALGDDTVQQTLVHVASNGHPSPKPLGSQFVVQVRETPYQKRKTDHGDGAAPSDSSPNQTHESSGTPKHTSSTSVVYSTYDMPKSSASAEVGRNHSSMTADLESKLENGMASAKQYEGGPDNANAEQPSSHETQDVLMADEQSGMEEAPKLVDEERSTRAELPGEVTYEGLPLSGSKRIPKSSIPPTEHLAPFVAPSNLSQAPCGPIKRKPDGSPTKSNRRHSKRREIKLVGFGDGAPSTVDAVAALRQEREDSFRRFREERKSNTSFESLAEPASKLGGRQDTDAMDVDSGEAADNRASSRARSPRHQSLYDEPSPRLVISNIDPAVPRTSRAQTGNTQPQATPFERRPVMNADFGQPHPPPTVADGNGDLTIFQSFKAAYPEYTGDAKHFQGQCTQMIKLDREDKMVPKWQWDDYIIRNRTDYKDYVLERVDSGESPEPYHRFYKNTIRNTLWTKGIIEDRQTLRKALEELGAGPEPPSRRSVTSAQKTKLSRQSLPEASHPYSRSTQDSLYSDKPNRPRHSLPAARRPPSDPQTSRLPPRNHEPVHARQPSNSSQLISSRPDGSTDAIQTTGDPFRDYFFAVQRSTSWTGSHKVRLFFCACFFQIPSHTYLPSLLKR
ncbi:hypothetical protein BDW02DRAFT_564610 [Decorospora gaudefroyi]|uniref:Telomere replication protein EST3 n=1 Tax=Decorospora gaudefroyi TaxID=184978 RepID=A0A6A5KRI3_9PLEO|nr:hypothetical protein BDW02DRAFT_564610 [Decorospora gaudefroyi]